MNDNGATDDILQTKLLDIHVHPGVTVAGCDWRKVACMIGVRLVIGVVVPAGICKIMGAISNIMNVKAVEGRNIERSIERQMEKFRIKNHSFVGRIIKFDYP